MECDREWATIVLEWTPTTTEIKHIIFGETIGLFLSSQPAKSLQ